LVIFRKRTLGVSETTIARFVERARRLIGMRESVNVLVTSSAHIKSLNRKFRRLDEPTDVLSFPTLQVGVLGVKPTAGDVVISAEIARENANRLGHSLEHEVKILVLHGILHLAGFDHEHDAGQMARKESRLRRQLNLETALIERTEENVAVHATGGRLTIRRRSAKRRTA
jgi:probable rRNA maturation factor